MMRRAAVLTSLALWLVCAAWGATAAAACAPGEVALRGPWGSARFTVEIADDPQERSRGLMFREQMPRGAGMLFVYEYPQQVAFWMRNTLIPLDMIFIDSRGVVRRIHDRAIPHDETAIPGGGPMLAVLEINGGLARAMGMTEGTEVQHPAFGASAAWPCE
jgi:uncharacterized membrane protein (UPF0127 family)